MSQGFFGHFILFNPPTHHLPLYYVLLRPGSPLSELKGTNATGKTICSSQLFLEHKTCNSWSFTCTGDTPSQSGDLACKDGSGEITTARSQQHKMEIVGTTGCAEQELGGGPVRMSA